MSKVIEEVLNKLFIEMEKDINNINENNHKNDDDLLWNIENNFNILTFEEQKKYLSLLLQKNNFDQIRKYIIENNRLRIAFHESAHLVVWTTIENKSYDNISIEEKKTIHGKSEWNVERNFARCKNDKNKIYISLAGYVAELWAWLDHITSYNHAKKDFKDIQTREDFEYIYENWYKPIGFKENGDIEVEQQGNRLSKEEIWNEIIQICYKEINNIAWILKENKEKYYTIAVELFKKWFLNKDDIEALSQ